MGERGALPPGWAWTTIGEIAVSINPGFPSGEHNQEGRGRPHLRPMNISAKGEIDLSEVKYVEVSDSDRLIRGDVLFNNTNSPAWVGKTAYIRQDTVWAYSNHMTRIRLPADRIDPAWVANSLHHLFLDGFFRMNCRHHVNQASISSGFLGQNVSIPLPPLPEQRRIVAEIEKQFTRLDAGMAALKRVQANLKRYRASVLKAACEGRLVPQDPNDEPADCLLARILSERRAKWGTEHPGNKYVEPAVPESDGLQELPEGWCWANLGQLAWDAGYGTSQRCAYEAPGPPVLRIPNIAKGRIDLNDLKYATLPGELNYAEALAPGDLIIIRTNGSKDLIGRSAVVRGAFIEPHFFASYLIRFRLLATPTVPELLGAVWNAPMIRRQIEGIAATSAGQYNVSMGALSRLLIPVPPLLEQHRIVAEVERRLSVVAEVETAVAANLARAGRLRQAILKRAFEGRLVEQDPADEPAGAPMEPIGAQELGRETTVSPPRTQQSKQAPLPIDW